ncbi:MAG: hypothetical protein HY925_06225 [Elusimicrobia bacterium]|nr:hypothetical protein [Elusimicrobiota bacterium]
MTISRSSALILWLAAPALAVPARPVPMPASAAPTLDALVRDSRAAYFNGNYEESAQLAMEALIAEPTNAEARDLLQLSAKTLAELDVKMVQDERAKLMEEMKKIRAKQAADKVLEAEMWKKEDAELKVRIAEVEKSRPLWSAWARAYLAHGEILEVYQLIYQVKDQFPNEAWVLPQLDRLSNTLKRDPSILEKRPPEYRDAVLGFSAYSDGRWKDAVYYWKSALEKVETGSLLPRESIERRLAEAAAKLPPEAPPVPVKKPVRRLPAAAAKPKPVEPPPAAAPAVPVEPASGDAKEVQALYTQGLVQYGFGHVSEAAKTWEQVLKLDPKHPSARRALERARHELEGGR